LLPFAVVATANSTAVNSTAPVSVAIDAMMVKGAISELIIPQVQAISNARVSENIAFQNQHAREVELCDSLLKTMKSIKDLHFLASLQGVVDASLRRVEELITSEQAAQLRYEHAMKSLNVQIKTLGTYTESTPGKDKVVMV